MPSTNDFNEGLWKEGLGQIAALYGMMEKAGVTRALLERLRSEPDYLKRLAEDAQRGAIHDTLSQQRARVYYCAQEKNFFGPREWWRLAGVALTPDHLRLVGHFPWPAELLDERDPFDNTKHIREKHFAFPMWVTTGSAERLEMISLKWLFHRFENLFFQPPGTKELGLNQHQFFRDTVGFPRWYLVRLEPPEVTTDKTFAKQLACVSDEYEPAPALIATAAHLFYVLAHGGFYQQKILGRCGDTLPGDESMFVSTAESNLHVELGVTDAESPRIGLNLMRKLPVAGGGK